jgi:hypothetical protein
VNLTRAGFALSHGDRPVAVERRRRLPLRDLLTDAERRTRGLMEVLNSQVLQRAAELRDLARGQQRKKGPTSIIALLHAIDRVVQEVSEMSKPLDELHAELEEIHEHANRERFNR